MALKERPLSPPSKNKKEKLASEVKQRHVVDAPPALLLRIKTSKSYSKQTKTQNKQNPRTNRSYKPTKTQTNKPPTKPALESTGQLALGGPAGGPDDLQRPLITSTSLSICDSVALSQTLH